MNQCLVCGEGCEFLIADEKQLTPCCSKCYNMEKNNTWKKDTQNKMKELFKRTREYHMRWIIR